MVELSFQLYLSSLVAIAYWLMDLLCFFFISACPNGMPFLLCLHHCQLASCPSHPMAKCTVDPCRLCKVEFKDDNGNIVNCTESKYAD